MHFLDYVVVLSYLAISLGLGLALRRQSNREEFFVAGRSMGRITVGLSVMATLFSANSFVMYPSAAYGNSLRILMAIVAFWMMGPIVAWVFIPVYSKLRCTTAYEYLEHRFHVSVRCLASSLFVLLRISWMAAATFAASVAISEISGIPEEVVTVGLGVVAIAYTMMGGLRAVMWTDVLQFFVFFGTILFAAGLLISQVDGGARQIAETYFADRENLLFDFSLDPEFRFGTIAILLGSFLEGLSAFGADQVAVQRYIAAKDEKTSRAGFWINLVGLVIVIPGLLAIGTGLFSYFHHHPQDMAPVLAEKLEEVAEGKESGKVPAGLLKKVGSPAAGKVEKAVVEFYRERPTELHSDVVAMKLNDKAMPRFVKLKFPAGVVGLLVAALMAATMSSIDSGIHSVTTSLVVDFRDRLFPNWRAKTEAGEMIVARLLVVLIGIVAIVLALFVGQLGDVFAVAKKTVGAFSAPLLAVFVCGLFFRRVTARGVFVGTWLGAGLTLWIMVAFDKWFSMWFFPIGFFSSLLLTLICSAVLGGHDTKRPPQTFWELRRTP